MLHREFYSELGKLLYSIAEVDGMISAQEKNKLLEMVKERLAPSEENNDFFKTNAAFYTEFEFEILDEQVADPEAAFNSFLNFVENNYKMFDANLKNTCVMLSKELAKEYYGTNKKENELIGKLKRKLEMLEKNYN